MNTFILIFEPALYRRAVKLTEEMPDEHNHIVTVKFSHNQVYVACTEFADTIPIVPKVSKIFIEHADIILDLKNFLLYKDKSTKLTFLNEINKIPRYVYLNLKIKENRL